MTSLVADCQVAGMQGVNCVHEKYCILTARAAVAGPPGSAVPGAGVLLYHVEFCGRAGSPCVPALPRLCLRTRALACALVPCGAAVPCSFRGGLAHALCFCGSCLACTTVCKLPWRTDRLRTDTLLCSYWNALEQRRPSSGGGVDGCVHAHAILHSACFSACFCLACIRTPVSEELCLYLSVCSPWQPHVVKHSLYQQRARASYWQRQPVPDSSATGCFLHHKYDNNDSVGAACMDPDVQRCMRRVQAGNCFA